VDTLKRAREYAESIVATVREPLLVLDADLRVQTASRSFYETFQGKGSGGTARVERGHAWRQGKCWPIGKQAINANPLCRR
jgi:hypothetical protein